METYLDRSCMSSCYLLRLRITYVCTHAARLPMSVQGHTNEPHQAGAAVRVPACNSMCLSLGVVRLTLGVARSLAHVCSVQSLACSEVSLRGLHTIAVSCKFFHSSVEISEVFVENQ